MGSTRDSAEVELADDGLPAAIRLTGPGWVFPPPESVAAAVHDAFVEAHHVEASHVDTTASGVHRVCSSPAPERGGLHPRPVTAAEYLDRVDAAWAQATQPSTRAAAGHSAEGRVEVRLRPAPALAFSCIVDELWARQVGPVRVESALAQALACARAALPGVTPQKPGDVLNAVLADLMAVLTNARSAGSR